MKFTVTKWLLIITMAFGIVGQKQPQQQQQLLGEEKSPTSESLTSNPCKTRTTCGACIAAHPSCAWCKQENFTDSSSRCDTITALLQSSCSGEDTVHPANIKQPTEKAKPFSGRGASIEDVVQLVPQEVHLKLRPNDPFPLDVHFSQAEDYPVDLYYLMDLSKSMEDDKDKLASLGILLANEMSSITQNFRLGFGSFVDKTVMPYVSTVPAKLREPCAGCAAPYGFKNHMPLHTNTSQFSEKVKEARVSGNLDAPEGGFDAIMQSVVCHKEISWRNISRKILVFSTDSGFHYAGDGKLGGIVTPNDGLCHLDKDGLYTESTNQDYPSLSQIRHKISEKKVNVIFAVTAGQVPIYKELSKNLEGAYTGKLANDSGNVVQLVREQYDQITSEVEMIDDASGNVKVTYYSKCLGNKVEKTNICKGLKLGNKVTFTAEIEVTSCPENRAEWKQTFQISPVGLNEALTVNLDMICECDCETRGDRFSPKCSGTGTYECGICECDKGTFGRFCECNDSRTRDDDSACKMGDSPTICSGRGTCECGVCRCHERQNKTEFVYGEYCECDNFSCEIWNGQFCGGKERGRCDCSKCICNEGYTGSNCNCATSHDLCIDKNDKEGRICNGRGKCNCGNCECESADYSGQYCGECVTCVGKCEEYRACVQCQAFGTGELKDSCHLCEFKIQKFPNLTMDGTQGNTCVFKDEDDCKFTFVYSFDERNQPIVKVVETKECPVPVNLLWIILGVIGGIVAVGLCLLLIWKLLTSIHDRREFAKFEKERQMAKWDTGENPIYKQATSTFKNPTYGGKQ